MKLSVIYEAYLKGLIEGNQRQCYETIQSALDSSVPMDVIYEEIFYPVMVEIGYLWETNEITVAGEHLATAITQQVMASMYHKLFSSPQKSPDFKAVVTCPALETHELSSRMFADLLVLNQGDVMYLGANVPTGDLIKLAESESIDFICISCTMENHLVLVDEIVEEICLKKDLDLNVLVGGRAFKKKTKRYEHLDFVHYAETFKNGIQLMKRLKGNVYV